MSSEIELSVFGLCYDFIHLLVKTFLAGGTKAQKQS